jgi:ABC-2 type transport system permease protein
LAWLVAWREIRAQLRSRAFIVSSVLFVVLIAAGIFAATIFGDGFGGDGEPAAPTAVAVGPGVSGIEGLKADPEAFELLAAASEAEALEFVSSGEAAAALLALPEAGPDGLPILLVAQSSAPDDVIAALTYRPTVSLIDPAPASRELVGYLGSLIFGVLFIWAAMLFGQTIAQNTVIEKQTRIVEILLAAVPARALMAGKVIGHSLLALGETALMAGTALVCLNLVGNTTILGLMTAPLLWYVLFFAIGFVFLASLFAGAAALVSRLEDVGTAIMPLTLLIMVPYVLCIALNQDATAMKVLSYIPIASTIAMPVRLMQDDAAWWEALIALALLIATAFGAIAIGARLYSNSLLQTDRKVKLLTALRSNND